MKVMGIYNAYNPILNSDFSHTSSGNHNEKKEKEEKRSEISHEINLKKKNIALKASYIRSYRKSIDSLFTNFIPNIPNKMLLKMNSFNGNISINNDNETSIKTLSDIIPQNPIFKVNNNDPLAGFEKIRRNYHYTKSKKILNKLKNHFGCAVKLLKTKEYIVAVTYLDASLKLAELIKHDQYKFVIFELLARTHDKLNDLTQALDYYLKAYEIADYKNLISKKMQIANNIASIYADYSNYEKSIEWYKKAYRFSTSLNDMDISKLILEDLIIAKKYQQIQAERVA